MKCIKCGCIFPSHYSACPSCGSKEYEREKFKQADIFGDIVEYEPVSAYVTGGELKGEELE